MRPLNAKPVHNRFRSALDRLLLHHYRDIFNCIVLWLLSISRPPTTIGNRFVMFWIMREWILSYELQKLPKMQFRKLFSHLYKMSATYFSVAISFIGQSISISYLNYWLERKAATPRGLASQSRPWTEQSEGSGLMLAPRKASACSGNHPVDVGIIVSWQNTTNTGFIP